MRTPTAIALVAVVCTIVQVTSASLGIRDKASPNTSTEIAMALAERGVYECHHWERLRGPETPRELTGLRIHHLPGHPIFQALAFKVLPAPLLPYLHVPVTVLLVASAAFVAARLAGAGFGLATGLVGTFFPFVIVHGPVWDDTFLAAALAWFILALLVGRCGAHRRPLEAIDVLLLPVLVVVGGLAAVTRVRAQPLLLLLLVAGLLWPRLRGLTPQLAALVLGAVVALGMWGYRNHQVLGEFALGSSHDGITLWESNYPHAIEAIVDAGQVSRLNDKYMQEEFAATADMSEVEADRYFRDRAVKYILTHPLAVAKTAAVKLVWTVTGYRSEEPMHSRRNIVVLVSNGLLFGLATLGLPLARLRPRTQTGTVVLTFGCLLAGLTLAMIIVGPPGMRYRLTVDPFLWMAAGLVLRETWTRQNFETSEREPEASRAASSAV